VKRDAMRVGELVGLDVADIGVEWPRWPAGMRDAMACVEAERFGYS
jgi:hypothetical protein